MTKENITGLELESYLESANITVNKNTVPNETRSPQVTSGIRIGTPSVTTRGMKEDEMIMIADWICDVIKNGKKNIKKIKSEVNNLVKKFPLPY